MKNDGKKYALILIDGASDYPVEALGGRTPLQVAKKPFIDMLAKSGQVGMVKTIPDGMSPGSDTANLSILGYDPARYATGRSSLEAISIGIELSEDDITFRCNLVTLSDEEDYGMRSMVDYSAGEITTEEARILVTDIDKKLGSEKIKFYPGVSYRHVIVWKNGPEGGSEAYRLIPPHDISGKVIKDYLPAGQHGHIFLDLMKKSSLVLKNHPLNLKRARDGKKPANSIWIWAKAKKPHLDSFFDKYGLTGSVISAVDLVKGIGISAGLKPVSVEGATGNIHTNFYGKAKAALSELEGSQDFVFIHIEAPDECSHQGNLAEKIRSIELIDSMVVKTIKEGLDCMKVRYSIMILPDHPTPLIKKTHTSDAVPFLIYSNNENSKVNAAIVFDETYPAKTGIFIKDGFLLMDYFTGKIK